MNPNLLAILLVRRGTQVDNYINAVERQVLSRGKAFRSNTMQLFVTEMNGHYILERMAEFAKMQDSMDIPLSHYDR